MQIMFFCTFEIALFSNFRALCNVIIILDAIFVTTGDPNEESIKTEIIDLGHPENVCSGLPNYPIALEGASGGLLAEKYPVVCGGLDFSTYEYVRDCIVLGTVDQKI